MDDSPLGKLMQDFKHTNAKDMNYSILADRVKYFKETDKGVSSMCKAMEQMRAEAAAEAAAKTAADSTAQMEQMLRQAGVAEEIIQHTVNQIMEPYKFQA